MYELNVHCINWKGGIIKRRKESDCHLKELHIYFDLLEHIFLYDYVSVFVKGNWDRPATLLLIRQLEANGSKRLGQNGGTRMRYKVWEHIRQVLLAHGYQ